MIEQRWISVDEKDVSEAVTRHVATGVPLKLQYRQQEAGIVCTFEEFLDANNWHWSEWQDIPVEYNEIPPQ